MSLLPRGLPAGVAVPAAEPAVEELLLDLALDVPLAASLRHHSNVDTFGGWGRENSCDFGQEVIPDLFSSMIFYHFSHINPKWLDQWTFSILRSETPLGEICAKPLSQQKS